MSEEGTNYPRALGRRNVPRSVAETLGRRNVPWTGIRERPIGPLAIALVGGETPVHLAQRFLSQVLPPRGTGLMKERVEQLRGQVEKNIPPPYVRPMGWPAVRLIERLPSAVADIRPTGPQRTVHPKKTHYSSIHVEM